MRSPAFRRQQTEDLYEPHVAPINRLVDSLQEEPPPHGRGWIPYVAPLHGGINARILSVLSDPGPGTRRNAGSGMLCIENDDPTAAKQCELLASVGLGADDVTPWNSYPWYINTRPTAGQLQAGLSPLKQLIELLPRLQVVLLQGGRAHDSWDRLVASDEPFEADLAVPVVRTYHPSPQALRAKDPQVRLERVNRRLEAMLEVREILDAAERQRSRPAQK